MESADWLRRLVSTLEGTLSFESGFRFYDLQDGGGTDQDFTTGLRDFVDGRSYGNPRHAGCQLAKLWGGSGFVDGGEWQSSFTEA